MAILSKVTQLVDGVDVVSAKDIMDTQETAISAINKAEDALEKANNMSGESYDDTELRNLIDKKVDKVDGMGLSSNDFTDDEKEKLAGLNNYDDTEIRQMIEGFESYDDTEVRELINGKVDKVEGKGLSSNDFTEGYRDQITLNANYISQLPSIYAKRDASNLDSDDVSTWKMILGVPSGSASPGESLKIIAATPSYPYDYERIVQTINSLWNSGKIIKLEITRVSSSSLTTASYKFALGETGITASQSNITLFARNKIYTYYPAGMDSNLKYFSCNNLNESKQIYFGSDMYMYAKQQNVNLVPTNLSLETSQKTTMIVNGSDYYTSLQDYNITLYYLG